MSRRAKPSRGRSSNNRVLGTCSRCGRSVYECEFSVVRAGNLSHSDCDPPGSQRPPTTSRERLKELERRGKISKHGGNSAATFGRHPGADTSAPTRSRRGSTGAPLNGRSR